MKQRGKVEIGQFYQSIGTITGAPVFTYRVAHLFESKVDHVEYARIVQIGDPSRTKSVAAHVLLNLRHFLPVAGEATPDAGRAA